MTNVLLIKQIISFVKSVNTIIIIIIEFMVRFARVKFSNALMKWFSCKTISCSESFGSIEQTETETLLSLIDRRRY